MATLSNFIIGLIAAIFIVAILFILIFVLQYIVWFHCKPCKHCGHTLEYRGILHEDGKELILFECPKCGQREVVSEHEFYRDCEKSEYNPNNLWP